MKLKTTFLIGAILIIVLACPGFILLSSSGYYPSLLIPSSNNSLEHEQTGNQQNKIDAVYFAGDTFDINIDMEEFDEEMKNLQKELEKLKSIKIEIDFDNEEFRAEMEELKKELSQLDFHKLQFEFDNEKFRKSMEELKNDLKGQKLSFDIDMDKFKEEMKGLREELKNLHIDFKDLDIELHKLDGFMDSLREELESDGLIKNKDDEFELDLNKDRMNINGEPVSEELFKKYKEMYEEHFGKKLNGDHNLIIR